MGNQACGPEPIEELKATCLDRNNATIRAAQARVPTLQQDSHLLHETWSKFEQDVAKGYIGQPQELDTVYLSEILLVDSFGVWEKHAGTSWKVRVINNFRYNAVNSYAWVPARMHYDNFTELMEAAKVLKSTVAGNLVLGKSDFKSAFKTLPTDGNQAWLSWCLVYNPSRGRHQVAPLKSQSFGSLGAVMAWYRTAMLIQKVLQDLFFLTTFVYVDDCFWVTLSYQGGNGPNAAWQACAFQYVVEELSGVEIRPHQNRGGGNDYAARVTDAYGTRGVDVAPEPRQGC